LVSLDWKHLEGAHVPETTHTDLCSELRPYGTTEIQPESIFCFQYFIFNQWANTCFLTL